MQRILLASSALAPFIVAANRLRSKMRCASQRSDFPLPEECYARWSDHTVIRMLGAHLLTVLLFLYVRGV